MTRDQHAAIRSGYLRGDTAEEMAAEAVASLTEAEVPQRVKIVKGHFVPEFPDECEPHTDSPSGYPGWDEWAERMAAAGHVQRQCKGCGLWAIWEPPATPIP